MTTDRSTGPSTAGEGRAAPALATGLARFAGLAMALLGVVQLIAATTTLFTGQAPDATGRNVFSLSAATWGWVHLGLGALVGLAGMFVIAGVRWGRVAGIVLAAASVVACFLSVSHHPGWSVIGIAIGILVIWALCVFDESASAAAPTMLDRGPGSAGGPGPITPRR
ncbi:MAG TPA: hypothetical protein VKZ81_10970 [Pseudonocardia sp.]|jgi:hypothetical protein|uniref:DUF7144 family membrane protein n=1 Tax=Pseudonocardia sp. TaxID=60912 RepID=UPI002B4B8AAC|nr:hypothetical protein [Pseudonocardia sp.]HLU55972.1 hypothetical protein [Pseudonocardia sp.]